MSEEYISEKAWEKAAIEAASFPILTGNGYHWRTYEMKPTVFRVNALKIQRQMDLEAKQSKNSFDE